MIDNPQRRAVLLGGGLLFAGVGTAGFYRVQAQVRPAPSPSETDAGSGGDASATLNATFKTLSENRVDPPGLTGWGVGTIRSPRGRWQHRSPLEFTASQIGFTLSGEAPYATTHLFSISDDVAIPLHTYVAAQLKDLYLRNTADNPGTSAGVGLNPEGGGGPLTIKRVAIDGFDTAIRLTGTANGDKALVEQAWFGGGVGFDNGGNKQAVGWTFLSCSGACAVTHFRLGGAGEVAIAQYVGNVFGSFVELPEASGNPGAAHLPARVTVSGTQLEYHGSGPRLLVDARRSVALTEAGGTNADIVLRDVTLASGTAAPDPRRHVVMQVGNAIAGSDAVRVRQEGGWIEGVVRHGSAQGGALNRRWSFRDAVRAPDPTSVELLGSGNHPLMEWRANENVPVDQYRGGQGFTGAIDAQKAFLWRHVGAALLNTGSGTRAVGTRHGDDFTIAVFPVGTTQMALAVYLDERITDGHDLQIRQFADASFRTPIGPTLALPAGTAKGLHRIHDTWHILGSGRLHVRITLPARQIAVRGALVAFYFPYMGS